MLSKSERVSIVLPTYNGSRHLSESIESCLAQTHADLEVIVVDDASDDDTPEVLRRCRDPRLRILRHETNRKLPAALNTGFASSSGNFLTWTSDDNRYHPDAISKMLAALHRNPEAGLVYAGFRLIDPSGNVTRTVEAEPPRMLVRKPVVGACFLYRREVYEQIGDYRQERAGIEDYDYWLRVAARFTIVALPEILYDYRVHPHSLTGSMSCSDIARAYDSLQTDVFGPDAGRFRRHLGELYMSRAFEAYLTSRYDKVAGNVLKGVINDRSFLGNRGVYSILVRSLWRKFCQRQLG